MIAEHQGLHELLGAFILGGLRPEEHRAFTLHLRGCTHYQREAAQLSGLPTLLSLVLKGPYGSGVHDGVRRVCRPGGAGLADRPHSARAAPPSSVVRAGSEMLGSIWAAVPGPLSDERTRAFGDAANLVALHLLRLRAGTDVQRRLQTDLLATALEGGVAVWRRWSGSGCWDVRRW